MICIPLAISKKLAISERCAIDHYLEKNFQTKKNFLSNLVTKKSLLPNFVKFHFILVDPLIIENTTKMQQEFDENKILRISSISSREFYGSLIKNRFDGYFRGQPERVNQNFYSRMIENDGHHKQAIPYLDDPTGFNNFLIETILQSIPM